MNNEYLKQLKNAARIRREQLALLELVIHNIEDQVQKENET
jgi:hypothetical protein